jgi:hypothetical protein
MITALARAPLARLTRTPRTRFVVLAWCALLAAVAMVTRTGGWVHGADHVLIETYGALVLPVLAYVIVGAVFGARSVSESTRALVALGANSVMAAMAAVAVAVSACALGGAALAAAVALIAHGTADPPMALDALTSAYAGALGGAAYAAWLTLGTALGRRGGGRVALLVVDWVLGAGSGATAAITPRAHLRNMLGGTPPMNLPESSSACALVILTIGCGLLATQRVWRRTA